MAGDRSGANQTIYLWEHEFVTQVLRMNALTNDTAWSPFASGMTDPELIAPPGSTLSNTVPGPCFVDPATHQVYGFLSASTVTTNVVGAPTGKLPNIWEADGRVLSRRQFHRGHSPIIQFSKALSIRRPIRRRLQVARPSVRTLRICSTPLRSTRPERFT